MKQEIHAKITISTGEEIVFLEGKMLHYWRAIWDSRGNNEEFVRILIDQLLLKDGKQITREEFDNFYMSDSILIWEVLARMVTPLSDLMKNK